MLKKKLKIPSTQFIQTSVLTEFEKEKEALNTKLADSKAKILKLKKKEIQWEKESKLLKENEKDLKVNLVAKEKELQVKGEVVEILAIMPHVEIDTTSLSNSMSQVKLRDVELRGLNLQNKNLEDMASIKEEEKNNLTERCQELIDQNAKLNKQVIGQISLQVCWHMI